MRAVASAVVVLLAAVLSVGWSAPLRAESRVALVIGNSAYKYVPELPNPRNDASDVASRVKGLGFQVFGGQDLDRAGMMNALTAFGRAAETADVALVFYAGHGLQMNGQNYLVPVDANVEYEAEVDIALVPFNLVMQQLNRGSRVNIALLDACRDNPFAKTLSRTMGTRAVELSRGLSRAPSVSGSFIAYSTQPDNVAQDGSGRNSPFTAALLKFIDRPGLSLPDLMIEVRKQVMADTNGKQVPWDSSSLTGRFSFKIEGPAATTPETAQTPPASTAGQDPRVADMAAWLAAQGSSDPQDYEVYLQQHPNGLYARQARQRIEALLHPKGTPPPAPARPAVPPDDETNAAALFQLGKNFENGRGVVQDFAQANTLFRKAANAGSSDAAVELGYNIETGRGAPKDLAEAVRLYRKAADAGNAIGMANLGTMYEYGRGIQQDLTEAVRLHRKAADAGNAVAMRKLADEYANGRGVPADFAQANIWYRKAADAGNTLAMRNLGQNLDKGRGTEQDLPQANEWYRKAAEAGDAQAMVDLGYNIEAGRGATKNQDEANRWYLKAADAGNAAAMRNLGLNYEYGRGFSQDLTQANAWFRKAADAGSPAAMANLGYNYEIGRGVPKDLTQAAQLYKKAADLGDPDGMNNLGNFYTRGVGGLPLDLTQARVWFEKSAALGNERAKANLKSMKRS